MKIYPETYDSNSVEALLETIDRVSGEMTNLDLFVPSELKLQSKPVSADVAMAVILDKLLATGFEPVGFSVVFTITGEHEERISSSRQLL